MQLEVTSLLPRPFVLSPSKDLPICLTGSS